MKKMFILFTIFSFISLNSFSQEGMIGEIKLFAGNFEPLGWKFCEGQILQISQNQALYSILGITYGGNGMTTFALPDLRDAVPINASGTRPQGTVNNGDKIKIDPTQTTTTIKTVALRYIICIQGLYPERE